MAPVVNTEAQRREKKTNTTTALKMKLGTTIEECREEQIIMPWVLNISTCLYNIVRFRCYIKKISCMKQECRPFKSTCITIFVASLRGREYWRSPVGWLAPLVAAQPPAEPQTINVPADTNKPAVPLSESL